VVADMADAPAGETVTIHDFYRRCAEHPAKLRADLVERCLSGVARISRSVAEHEHVCACGYMYISTHKFGSRIVTLPHVRWCSNCDYYVLCEDGDASRVSIESTRDVDFLDSCGIKTIYDDDAV
jgi:hypothetical protein